MELLKVKRLATLRTAVVASVGVHGVLIVAALVAPLGAPNVEAAEVVTMEVVDVMEPPQEPAPSAPPPPAAPRPRLAPRTLVATAATAKANEPVPEPAPSAIADEAPPEPTAPVVAAGGAVATGGPAGATTGGVPGGATGGIPGGTGVVSRPVDDAQRRILLGRYRELMRGRIGAAFQYPAAARELELAGEVIVEITVDRTGALKRARLRGACPHALLCEDALRTVRAAAPFPALPPDLAGDAVPIDVPLRYDFE